MTPQDFHLRLKGASAALGAALLVAIAAHAVDQMSAVATLTLGVLAFMLVLIASAQPPHHP